MKQVVLHQSEVESELAQRFVAVQVDLTNNGSDNPNQATAQKYNVRSYPTLLAMNVEGQVIGTYNGGLSPEAFLAWLDGIGD